MKVAPLDRGFIGDFGGSLKRTVLKKPVTIMTYIIGRAN